MITALAFSGGKDSMACLHLLRDEIDIALYVHTGHAYPETLALVDYARTIVPVQVVYSKRTEQNDREGIPADIVPIDWTRMGQEITGPKDVMVQSYLGCCYENISAPLLAAAKKLGVKRLVYGQRNDEHHKSTARNGDIVNGIERLHPIEEWSATQVIEYLASRMDVPAHYRIKHSSLDCYDCTGYARDSADRIEWMRHAHPAMYVVYALRANALARALESARSL